MADFIAHLNEAQREGVLHTEGPTLIIAGAGSGKTRVLTYRIAYLLQKGVSPFNILSLTFTNKAAKEMRERIEQLVGTDARGIWMGTFHSMFARILRMEAERLGFTSNFTIYDTDDSKALLKTIIKALQLDEKKDYKPAKIFDRISSAKNVLLSPAAYQKDPDLTREDEEAKRPLTGKIYQLYAERCRRANAMDFDDLLFYTHKLFAQFPDALHKYQHRFKYVLVDEFQDTNLAQYFILKRLAAMHENICAVGDDAQSIYAFRGADIRNILNFERDFQGLKTIKLEQNYRSTQRILDAANRVIGKNQNQIPKTVWTENPHGENIELIKATSDNEEGRLVATSIFEEKLRHNLQNKDFAILYRTNAQSRAIEEALRRMSIPYRIYGGLSFYQRKEIKDLLAYVRLALNPNDEESLKRIINFPKRGIGKTTLDKILVAAHQQNARPWDILQNPYALFPRGGMAKKLEAFVTMVQHFQVEAAKKHAGKAVQYIAKTSGLLKHYHELDAEEPKGRYENLTELVNAATEFAEDPEREDRSLTAFAQEVALMTSQDEGDAKDPENQDKVTLMTIHAAKGLEFSQVFLMGMEEELFPSSRMIFSREDLEEERRLFYVAITRAKRKLTLSYALQRFRFGQVDYCEPSRFLFELGIDELRDRPTVATLPKDRPERTQSRPNQEVTSNQLPERPADAASYRVQNPNDLSEGMRVMHIKFGPGTIASLDIRPAGSRARITFDNFGDKTMMLSFAKLKVLKEE